MRWRWWIARRLGKRRMTSFAFVIRALRAVIRDSDVVLAADVAGRHDRCAEEHAWPSISAKKKEGSPAPVCNNLQVEYEL